jgi:hypothetical protein
MRLRDRLNDNAPAIQALGAILTVLLTLGAVVGIKIQIDASAQLQREQSARDIYREFLNLSISRPELSDPDYCKIKDGPQYESYLNYIEYLLYTSEQMLAASKTWEPGLEARLDDHRQHFCQADNYWTDYTQDVQNMVIRFRAQECKTPEPVCPDEPELDPNPQNATDQ